MKKFKYQFETVLNVKEKKEEQLKRELMHLQALKLKQEQILQQIKEERTKANSQKNRENEAGLNISTLIYYEQYVNSLRLEIENTNEKIKELMEQAENKRKEVVEASKVKKILEKLKSKDLNEFNRIIIAHEQKELDEAAVNKFNRKEQKSY